MQEKDIVICVLTYKNKFLCLKRPKEKDDEEHWEFVGGKIENNETNKQAIIREVKEELVLDINPTFLFKTNHSYQTFSVNINVFHYEILNDNVLLYEHSDYRWLPLYLLESLNWLDANYEIINILKQEFSYKKGYLVKN